jgi:hypothetical protein
MTIIEPPIAVVLRGQIGPKKKAPWRRPAPEAPRGRESHYAANFSTVPVLVAVIATRPEAATLWIALRTEVLSLASDTASARSVVLRLPPWSLRGPRWLGEAVPWSCYR